MPSRSGARATAGLAHQHDTSQGRAREATHLLPQCRLADAGLANEHDLERAARHRRAAGAGAVVQVMRRGGRRGLGSLGHCRCKVRGQRSRERSAGRAASRRRGRGAAACVGRGRLRAGAALQQTARARRADARQARQAWDRRAERSGRGMWSGGTSGARAAHGRIDVRCARRSRSLRGPFFSTTSSLSPTSWPRRRCGHPTWHHPRAV